MPTIVPNLMLLDADSAAIDKTNAAIAQFPCQLTVVDDLTVGLRLGADDLFDLLVCDLDRVAPNRQVDDVIAMFHALRGCHDVPVLFLCAMQHSGVSLKKHRWGVAYHVHKTIDTQAMIGLIQTSLTLRVEQPVTPFSTRVPKPLGMVLPLPEVVLPPHSTAVSHRNAPTV